MDGMKVKVNLKVMVGVVEMNVKVEGGVMAWGCEVRMGEMSEGGRGKKEARGTCRGKNEGG